MPKGYTHLVYEQRCQIYVLLKSNISQVKIANELGVSQSTISREVRRNKGKRGYRYKQAHTKSVLRRRVVSQRKRKTTAEIMYFVEHLLCERQWSPEQISGRMSQMIDKKLSHETIYKHIWKDKRNGGKLYKNLRQKGKKHNKRGGKKAGRGLIPGRVGIEERPAIVNTKQRIGDFELDTIVGAHHKGAIVSMVDRKSKLTRLVLIPKARAEETKDAIVQALLPLKEHVCTLTADNGKEFAKHAAIAEKLEAAVYFADPYSSWQRGLNENTNGLVRQYFPKKTDFTKLTQEEVKYVEHLLNTRPRKSLKYKTPIEVFYAVTGKALNYALRC